MRLENFTRQWIVGDFEPSLAQTKDVEIGIVDMPYGAKGDSHFHLKHTEHNLVLSGAVRAKGKIFFENDIFTYYPGEKSDVEFLSNTKLLVIKTPSTKGDKHFE